VRHTPRKITRLRRVTLVAGASVFCSVSAGAQVPTSDNVFFGYSFENAGSSSFDFSNLGRPNLNGWEASLEGKVFPWVGFVADFGRHYASQSYQFTEAGFTLTVSNGEEYTLLFGPRVSVPVGKFRPFAEGLFGAAHTQASQSSPLPDNFIQPHDTSFATALGGGIDYKILRPIALRVEADYVRTGFFGAAQNNIRLSTGIVLRF